MAYFAVTMVHGPSWDEAKAGLTGIRQQEAFGEHATFMDRLVDDGFVVLGGPLGDGEEAMLIVDARDQAEVIARMAEDPWNPMGVLHVGEVRPWAIWLGAPEHSGIS